MDVKPIIDWAQANGEAKVVERLLVKLLPDLMEHDMQVTAQSFVESDTFDVPESLYKKIQTVAEELVGKDYSA